MGRMLGGAMYDEEGRLRLLPELARSDYTNLFSSRRDRLVYESYRQELRRGSKGALIESGQFLNRPTAFALPS